MKGILKCCIAVLTVLVMSVSMTGCKQTEYKKDDKYVSSVKRLVNESVSVTRIWKEQDETFNCHDTISTKEYIASLDKLTDIYKELVTLQASDKFDEYDKQMKDDAKNALSVTSDIKSLVKYALEQSDDSLFQKEKKDIFQKYQECCDNLTLDSSRIQTFWRNA